MPASTDTPGPQGEAGELAAIPAVSPSSRLVAGLTWSALYQMFETVLSLAALLVLARIIAPAEYGRAAATVSLLGFVNAFGTHLFVGQALQLSEDDEPDWSLHWTLAFYVQTTLFVACHLFAAALWAFDSYRPLAPLLHVAAFGLLLEGPSQIGATMSRRQLDFARLKTVTAVAALARIVITMLMALAGAGAYAIIIGGNVVGALPFSIDLIAIRGWRPAASWWRRPAWGAARPLVSFGLQHLAMAIAASCRSALEAALLPRALGFNAMGLLNRAQALYGTTVGRASAIVVETVYPFLPRAQHDATRFANHATVFLQVMLLLAIPGALFVGLEGPALSRVLYGAKWIAMDPLIWPGTIIGVSAAVFSSCFAVVLASGRIRRCLAMDVFAAAMVVPAVTVAMFTRDTMRYAAVLAFCEAAVAIVALSQASRLLAPSWPRRVIVPGAVTGGGAAAMLFLGRSLLPPLAPAVQMGVSVLVFGGTAISIVGLLFPQVLAMVLHATGRVPRAAAWLRGLPDLTMSRARMGDAVEETL